MRVRILLCPRFLFEIFITIGRTTDACSVHFVGGVQPRGVAQLVGTPAVKAACSGTSPAVQNCVKTPSVRDTEVLLERKADSPSYCFNWKSSERGEGLERAGARAIYVHLQSLDRIEIARNRTMRMLPLRHHQIPKRKRQ